MRRLILIIALTFSMLVKAQKLKPFAAVGLDYRQELIDIEDVPRGGSLTSTYGELTHAKFWQALSLHGRFGIKTKNNWLFSIVGYTRYNPNHYLEDPYSISGPTTTNFNENTKSKSKIKFDVFLDVEKKIKLSKNEEKYLTILSGLGLMNINSQADLYYKPNIPGGTSEPKKYVGSYFDFGPKLSLGYQFKKIKGSLDAYFTEDELKTNLTAMWVGVTISYELNLKRKKDNSKQR
jgi:hypothetical protein